MEIVQTRLFLATVKEIIVTYTVNSVSTKQESDYCIVASSVLIILYCYCISSILFNRDG